jgi:subtilisin family serine protease
MPRLSLRVLTLIVLILTLAVNFVSAQPEQPVVPKNPFRTGVSKTDFNAMLNTAATRGSVQVIVGLQTANLQGLTDAARSQTVRAAQQALLTSLAGQNVRVIRQFDFIPYITLRVDAAALQAVQRSPLVGSITKDGIAVLSLSKSATQVGAKGVGGAWEMGYNGAGQTVAVLDSGVDKTHPAFGNHVVSEACYSGSINPDELDPYGGGTVASACPGGVPSSTASNSGLNCPDAYFGCFHGTHVAGIVASNDATQRGIAPAANLIAVQVFSLVEGEVCVTVTGTFTQCVLSADSDYIAGLERVYALRQTYSIAAANMSLGGGEFSSQAVCDTQSAPAKAAIDLLRTGNIPTVAASGNDGFTNAMGTPGCISSAISVGSVSSLNIPPILGNPDTVSWFSNSTSFLTLLAPGGDCTYIAPLDTCLLTDGITSTMPGGGFELQPGTSMAAPHVAGAWALLKQAKPSLTIDEAKNAFINTGKPITDTRPGAGDRVKPRIQIKEAIVSVGGQPNNTPTPTATDNLGITETPAGTDTPSGSATPASTFTPTATPDGSETPAATATAETTPDSTATPENTPDGTLSPTITATTPPSGDELLINGGFEASELAPWTGKNLSNDKVKCNKDKDGDGTPDKIVANDGSCAFIFRSGAGEASGLAQAIAPGQVTTGDVLTFSGAVNAKGSVNTAIKVRVKYADISLPKGKITVKLTAPTEGYVLHSGGSELTLTLLDDATNVKVQLKNRGTSGKVFYDSLSLVATAPGLLPLP